MLMEHRISVTKRVVTRGGERKRVEKKRLDLPILRLSLADVGNLYSLNTLRLLTLQATKFS